MSAPLDIYLVVEGKKIEIKTPTSQNFELNKALLDPAGFQRFVDDPKGFTAQYGIQIDSDLAAVLQKKLSGIISLSDALLLAQMPRIESVDGPNPCDVAAVAKGAFAISSSKIAIAV